MLRWRDSAFASASPTVSTGFPAQAPGARQVSLPGACQSFQWGKIHLRTPQSLLAPSAENSAALTWLSLKVIASGRLSRTTPAEPGPFLHTSPQHHRLYSVPALSRSLSCSEEGDSPGAVLVQHALTWLPGELSTLSSGPFLFPNAIRYIFFFFF